MGERRLGTILGRLLLAFFAIGLVTAPAAAASFDCGTALMRCRVQLDDSGRAWFESLEKLTEDALGDGTLKNGVMQVYKRVGNETTLVSRYPDGRSIGPGSWQGAASLLGVSPDGGRVYIQTEASLVPEDGDGASGAGSSDGYVISGGAYGLFTTGPLDAGPNTNPYAGSQGVWASDDGRYVYFATGQQLVPEDWDAFSDIYQRFEGQTRLVSTGPDQTQPTAEFPSPAVPETRFLGASEDGATAYFATAEHLTADDGEKAPGGGGYLTSDIFAWRDGVTTRLTRTISPQEVPGTPWEAFDPYSFTGPDEAGWVYFAANSAQTPDDTDANRDVYRANAAGALERVIASGAAGGGPGTFMQVQAVSRDGSRLFLFSNGQLAAADRDSEADIYMWSGGSYQLISPAGDVGRREEELHFCSISRNGARAYFQTWASLSSQDSDEEPDVYEWSEGAVRLVSPASDGRQSASFCSGISPNGRFVAFSTWEELIPGDADTKQDVYVIDMGAASASSSGAANASAALRRNPGKRGRRRLRLITAESIAPRMGVARVAHLTRDGVRLRLRCPRSERSGPCRGWVKLLAGRSRRVLAAGTFRVPAGRAAAVRLRGRNLPRRAVRVLARVRAADLLGNSRTSSSTVGLR